MSTTIMNSVTSVWEICTHAEYKRQACDIQVGAQLWIFQRRKSHSKFSKMLYVFRATTISVQKFIKLYLMFFINSSLHYSAFWCYGRRTHKRISLTSWFGVNQRNGRVFVFQHEPLYTCLLMQIIKIFTDKCQKMY